MAGMVNKFGVGGCCCNLTSYGPCDPLRGEQGILVCGGDLFELLDHHYLLVEIYGCGYTLDGRYLLEFFDYDYQAQTIKLRRKRSGLPTIQATAHIVGGDTLRFDTLNIVWPGGSLAMTGGAQSGGKWQLTGNGTCCPMSFLLASDFVPTAGFLCTSRLYDGLYAADQANWQVTQYATGCGGAPLASYDFDILETYNEWDGWIYDCTFGTDDLIPATITYFKVETTYWVPNTSPPPAYHSCGFLQLVCLGEAPPGVPFDHSVAVGCAPDAAYPGDPGWDPATSKHDYQNLQSANPCWDIHEV